MFQIKNAYKCLVVKRLAQLDRPPNAACAKLTTRLTLIWRGYRAALILFMGLVFFACGLSQSRPVYVADRQALIDGSVFYNEAGCARCHGVAFDGKGPEASEVTRKLGFAPSNFKVKLDPKKTPLDYFRVVTMGTKRYQSHSYHNYTDRGRWSMAHYLYSLAKPLQKSQKKTQRRQVLMRMYKEVSEVYAKKRRWDMGYVPIEKRPTAPDIDVLLRGKKGGK